MKKEILILFCVSLLIFGCNAQDNSNTKLSDTSTVANEPAPLVDPSKILSGGPGKGGIGKDRGIPALAKENIKFVTVQEANKWIEDNALVGAVTYKGEKRVYPLQILVWHEIVNDHVGKDPLLVTYCPLCGSVIAYKPMITIEGKEIESRFGTSGKLYNSNLIMYDEETETYWQQIDGKAIQGPLVGQELVEVTIDTVRWDEWSKAHPDSKVLSQETGMSRNYGRDPYPSYYESSHLIFPVENSDDSVHPKDVIFGIEVNGVHKAYREKDISGKFEDTVNNVKITVEKKSDGTVSFTSSDKEFVKERDFWFAWYAFHPNTQLYEK